MRTIGVIPARFASTRFPGKPLAPILGRPMIQWVYERCQKITGLADLVVATDDARIATAVRGFGGSVVMTDDRHLSGTDRLAEVARNLAADAYLNIQGDEPTIAPSTGEAVLNLLSAGKFQLTTAMTPLTKLEEWQDAGVVKVICDQNQRAIYFSRFPIPHSRQRPSSPQALLCQRHIGIYGYLRETLLRLSESPASPIELAESLEQLRAMELGIAIGVAAVSATAIGVDTPSDVARVEALLSQESFAK